MLLSNCQEMDEFEVSDNLRLLFRELCRQHTELFASLLADETVLQQQLKVDTGRGEGKHLQASASICTVVPPAKKKFMAKPIFWNEEPRHQVRPVDKSMYYLFQKQIGIYSLPAGEGGGRGAQGPARHEPAGPGNILQYNLQFVGYK